MEHEAAYARKVCRRFGTPCSNDNKFAAPAAVEAILVGIGWGSGIAFRDLRRIDAAELADAERALKARIEAARLGVLS